MKKTFIDKVNITVASRFWDGRMDLADVFTDLDGIKILGVTVEEGKVDIWFSYEEEQDDDE